MAGVRPPEIVKEGIMILVRFSVPGMTSDQYDGMAGALDSAMRSARGFVAHAAGPHDGGAWEVSEIWESRAAWDDFSRDVFMPAVEAMGGLPGDAGMTLIPLHTWKTASV